MHFDSKYFAIAAVIFIVEVLIALFVHDDIVRPYVGDALVVVLIYVFVRAFLKISINAAAMGTLVFAFAIEFLQYFEILDKLNLRENQVARIVIGTSFAWEDLLMYIIGILVVLLAENKLRDARSR